MIKLRVEGRCASITGLEINRLDESSHMQHSVHICHRNCVMKPKKPRLIKHLEHDLKRLNLVLQRQTERHKISKHYGQRSQRRTFKYGSSLNLSSSFVALVFCHTRSEVHSGEVLSHRSVGVIWSAPQ